VSDSRTAIGGDSPNGALPADEYDTIELQLS